MANHDNYPENKDLQSSIDYVGIETKPRHRPPISDNQLDDLTVWLQRGLYSINQMCLLMAGISPFKCESIDSAYSKGYSDYQLERAVVLREAMLDGLEIGDLTAFKLVVYDWHGNERNVTQEDFQSNYSRSDVSIASTTILKNVLLDWIKRKQYKSVRRDIEEYNSTIPQEKRILLPNEYTTPSIELLKDHIEQNLIGADEEYLTSTEGLRQQKQYLEQNGKRMGLGATYTNAIHTVARSPLATEKYTKHHPVTGKKPTP